MTSASCEQEKATARVKKRWLGDVKTQGFLKRPPEKGAGDSRGKENTGRRDRKTGRTSPRNHPIEKTSCDRVISLERYRQTFKQSNNLQGILHKRGASLVILHKGSHT